jgi:uracil-DNA glycosylase family 4
MLWQMTPAPQFLDSPLSREHQLRGLHDEIRSCRQCALAGHPISGMPVASGEPAIVHRERRLMLVGQAPGRTEAGNGRPFSGPAGRRLFQWLAAAGVDEASFRAQVYMAAMTRCYPGPAPAGHGDRRPTRSELALCRGYLDRALALVQPHVIILVGGLAIHAFMGTRPLADVVGTAHDRDGMTLVPLPHPSGASTWTNRPAHAAMLARALAVLKEVWQATQRLEAPPVAVDGLGADPAEPGRLAGGEPPLLFPV